MILIVVKHPVRPENADDWPSLMEEFTTATRAEPGNVCFDWYRSVDDPNVYVLVEAFRDGAAGEAHVKSEHFQAAIARLPQLLADVPEIVNVEVPGDGWSRMAELQVDAER
ncbi:MAG TPA: putative quinol monooxygenase [Acidimicrobiia bacterium]